MRNRKIGFVLSIVFVISLVSGCNPKVKDEVVSLIKKNSSSDEKCTLKMSEITPFIWDEFYFFDRALPDQEVNEILGTQVRFFDSPFSHGTHKLIFFKNGEVVHSEKQSTHIEESLDGEVRFDIIDHSKKYGKFPKGAVFEVEKLKSGNGEHYLLTCINCN